MNNIKMDSYVVSTNDHQEFLEELERIEGETELEEIPDIKSVDFYGFERSGFNDYLLVAAARQEPSMQLAPCYGQSVRLSPEQVVAGMDQELLIDTLDNARLVLASPGYSGRWFLRKCCIRKLMQIAGIHGRSLERQFERCPEDFAEMIQSYIRDYGETGKAIAIVIGGKLTGIVSTKYRYMPYRELIRVAEACLEATRSRPVMYQGICDHTRVEAYYDLPEDQTEILKRYRAFLDESGIKPLRALNMMPGICITSSGTGNGVAHISPVFRQEGKNLIVRTVTTSSVKHIGQDEDYSEWLEVCGQVFAKLNETVDCLGEMAKTIVRHQLDWITSACKRSDIPKDVTAVCVEAHRALGDGICSVHDCYLSVFEGIEQATEEQGLSSEKRLELSEKASKISTMTPWHQFDHAVVSA